MGENYSLLERFEADQRNQSIAGNGSFFMGVGDGLEVQGWLFILFENTFRHPFPIKIRRARMGIVQGVVARFGQAQNQADDIVWMPLVKCSLLIRGDHIIGRCRDLRTVGNFFRIIEDSF